MVTRRNESASARSKPCALGTFDIDEHDLGGIVGVPCGLDQGLEIGAAARDQDADALPRHLALPASVPCVADRLAALAFADRADLSRLVAEMLAHALDIAPGRR